MLQELKSKLLAWVLQCCSEEKPAQGRKGCLSFNDRCSVMSFFFLCFFFFFRVMSLLCYRMRSALSDWPMGALKATVLLNLHVFQPFEFGRKFVGWPVDCRIGCKRIRCPFVHFSRHTGSMETSSEQARKTSPQVMAVIKNYYLYSPHADWWGVFLLFR